MLSDSTAARVLVVGSLNADLVTRVPRLPAPGETVLGDSFDVLAGGKGANQAVAAARCGAAVRMIGRVGADAFGAMLRDELSRAGVDARGVGVDPRTPTGTAQIVVDAKGRNQIAVAPGANFGLTIDAVEPLHLWDEVSAVVLQLEVPMATNEAAARLAAERRVPLILNAAPFAPLSAHLLERLSWLVVNEIEAGQLVGAGAVRGVADAHRAAVRLADGRRGAIVTLGAAGAVMVSSGKALHQSAAIVTVVDTVAAGDAFVGAFAASIARSEPAAEALSFAVGAGSLACTRAGAIPSLPRRGEVAALRASLAAARPLP